VERCATPARLSSYVRYAARRSAASVWNRHIILLKFGHKSGTWQRPRGS